MMAAETETGALEKKFKLMEQDRKAHFENSQAALKQTKEQVRQLRLENKDLKTSLSSLSKSVGGVSDQTVRDGEIRNFDEKIIQLRRKYDEARALAESKRHELQRVKGKLTEVEKESQPILTDESPLTRKITMLENRLDKSMIKYNEALSIRKTYEQIAKRLREERIGFDNQLAAIERTLKAKDHDYQELLNMSHDANHAKEISKAELAQFRAAYEEERRQKDKELAERKQYVQSRLDQTQKLERREKLRRAQELEAAQRAEEEKAKAGGLQSLQSTISEQRSEEEQERQSKYAELYRKIKEVTGATDINEVIQKFLSQDDTNRSLMEITKEAQAKIEELNAERSTWKAKVEELKYSGAGQLGSRRIVDEFETHLAEAQNLCEKNRQKYERVAKILIAGKAGVEHLYDKLCVFKPDPHPIPMADETAGDVIKACEGKLLLLLEEALSAGSTTNCDVSSLNVELPSYNRRIKLPNTEEEVEEIEEDEEEEEEDVLDRDTVKKLATIAVQRETKKLKKRKNTAGRQSGNADAS
eukprot:TRINITY_DN323_c0_g3_i1.p1 TRINITY_DN323_c0_g3~~TRINITY_DN323_c0_g3_i1.p1  ORF type:complete len:531 (+),score=169.51 TRINITY_DN323_c0_g3_i1:197-1789(+)